MSRRTLLNLVLLLIVAGLALFIALAPREVAESTRAPLTSLDATGISRIVIEPADAERIEIVRSEHGWRLVHPLDAPANEFRVLALLALLGAPVHARFEAENHELARYGLAPPRVRVRLDDTRLDLGDTEALDGRRYVARGSEVALVDDVHLRHLDARPASFVSPAPLGPEPVIVEIRLPQLRVRHEAGRWRLDPAQPWWMPGEALRRRRCKPTTRRSPGGSA